MSLVIRTENKVMTNIEADFLLKVSARLMELSVLADAIGSIPTLKVDKKTEELCQKNEK